MLLDTLNGYQAMSTKQVNHLLYMDDLKLFAKTDVQLERLPHVVHMFSNMFVSPMDLISVQSPL